jgi:hypothetical protein
MIRRLNLYFLTLVVVANFAFISSLAFANPHTEAPEIKDAKVEPSGPAPEPYRNDLMSVTPVGEPPQTMSEYSRSFSKSEYFYPYRQTLTPRVGLIFGLRDASDEDDIMNVLLGFNYLVKRDKSPQWEVGADLSLASAGHINIMKRRIYNERGSFRPYYKYGVSHKFITDEKFASISNWENYMARAGLGFEDILRPPRSLRLELEAAIGPEDIFIIFTYGYSYGW